jgi:hypothetical protein
VKVEATHYRLLTKQTVVSFEKFPKPNIPSILELHRQIMHNTEKCDPLLMQTENRFVLRMIRVGWERTFFAPRMTRKTLAYFQTPGTAKHWPLHKPSS